MEALLRFAIEHKKMLSLTYFDLVRIVEPYMYGVHTNGQQVLYCYQTDGDSCVEQEGWREFFLFQIHDVLLLSDDFCETRDGYRNHISDLSTIFCQIPETE